MNSQISKAGLVDDLLGSAGQENIQGEEQKKLDVYANKIFINALSARGEVCGIASEEEEKSIILENEAGVNGKYIVLIDPIDGSSNIEVNVSIGPSLRFTADYPRSGPRLYYRIFTTRTTTNCSRICDFWIFHHVSFYFWKWREWFYL